MLTIKKSEVLKDLPPKIEEIVILDANESPKLAELDRKILSRLPKDEQLQSKFLATLDGDLHIATYRRMVGEEKIDASVEFIKDALENSKEHILVFAHHKAVIEKLSTELAKYKPLVVTGSTPMQTRHENVEAFQSGKSRVFIGQIQAAGTGLTLTRATRVIFVEFSWVDADNVQAADRCVLKGQEVLTPKGWARIEKVRVGDRVFNRFGAVVTVTDVWSRGNLKDVCDIRVFGWPDTISVTIDHRVLVGGKYVPAGKLKLRDRLSLPKPAGFAVDVDCETLYIYGYYIGDGFTSTGREKGAFVSM
jgi:hypothetical protein